MLNLRARLLCFAFTLPQEKKVILLNLFLPVCMYASGKYLKKLSYEFCDNSVFGMSRILTIAMRRDFFFFKPGQNILLYGTLHVANI